MADRVDELIDLFGLSDFADHFIHELSTGTRRLVDLASVVAHQPSVVLLDEPSSGVAQREVEAMGDLLRRVQTASWSHLRHRGARHRFVSPLADRLVALDQGHVLAEGAPGGGVVRPPRSSRPSSAPIRWPVPSSSGWPAPARRPS